MALETKRQQRDRLLTILNNLPNGFEAEGIDELKTMINQEFTQGGSLDEAERRVCAVTMTWGQDEIGFYDGIITEAERQRQAAVKTVKKYTALTNLLKTAEAAYRGTQTPFEVQEGATESATEALLRIMRSDLRIGEATHDTMVRSSLMEAQRDLASRQADRADIEKKIADARSEMAEGEAIFIQHKEEEYYLDPQNQYVERYKATLGKFFGFTRGKFEKLPQSEQARLVKEWLGKQPAESYVAFDAVDSNKNGPITEARKAYKAHIKKLEEDIEHYEEQLEIRTTAVLEGKYARNKVVRAIEGKESDLIALTGDIEKLSGKIARYNDFVKLNFEDRQAIVAAASQAFGEDFAKKLQSHDINAEIAFNRASRIFYAKQDLKMLDERLADFETLTPEQYLTKHGETHDQTVMSRAALQGYIDTLEGQPKFMSRIENKVENESLRAVLARDMNRDSFDYLERAFAHYYHQGFYTLPNNDTKSLDADIRNLFVGQLHYSYVGYIEDRIKHERARAIAARERFKDFVKDQLTPVASEPGTVDISEDIAKKLGMLAERRESVLTSKEGETVESVRGGANIVKVDKTIVRDIDYVMADPTVARYTALTMMREELLAKSKGEELSEGDKAKLAEVSAQLTLTIEEATKKGLLCDLIESHKVAAETSMPGYDRLLAFAKAKGLDITNPEHRKLLRTPEMQIEFDKVFVESAKEHQPEDLLVEIQNFIAANEDMREKIKIELVDGKPYLNFREYKILHKQGDPILDKNNEPTYDDPKPLLDANGNPILDDKGNPRMSKPQPRLYTENVYELDEEGKRIEIEGSQNGVLLTDEMMQNPELLAAFGFEMKEGMVAAVKVEQPKSYSIKDILDVREQLVQDAIPDTPSITLYGNASTLVDVATLEAMMRAELSDAYRSFIKGENKSYYTQAVAITKKYMQAIYDSKPVEARVETPREEAPADPPPAVEPPKTTTMTSEATFRTEKRTRQGKELSGTKKKLEEKFLGKKVFNEETQKEERQGGFVNAITTFDATEKSPGAQAMLDQAVAMAFGATLEYINTYNLSEDVIAALNEQLAKQGIVITATAVLDSEGNPVMGEDNKPLTTNAIVRETEGATQTFTLGQDGKVNVVEKPKVLEEQQGGGGQ